MPEYDIQDYSLTVEEAYADPMVRAELEYGAPQTFAAARLAERAGLDVRAEVTSFGPGETPFARWEVTVPPAVAKQIAAAVWSDSEGHLGYTLTPSVDGTHWRLTSWARDGGPWGHRELPEVEDAFAWGVRDSGVPIDGLAQIVLRDGTVLVREGFTPLAINPSAREVRKALRKAGCEELRQKGSHMQVQCPPEGRQTTVPVHGSKDIARGTLRSIERSVGIDVDGDGRPRPHLRKLARRLSNP